MHNHAEFERADAPVPSSLGVCGLPGAAKRTAGDARFCFAMMARRCGWTR